jgi:hypothetical protein
MSFRLSYANVVATICLVAVAGLAAVGATAQSGGSKQLAACYKKKGKAKGSMRMLTKASAKCKRSEKKVSWNQRGPAGVAGVDAVAPGGAVMFFDLASCPAGWTAYENARGRSLVGLQGGGALGATVGSALGDQENRAVGQHSHGVTDPGHGHNVLGSGAALRVPASVISFAGRGAMATLEPSTGPFDSGIVPGPTGITVDPSGAVGGTNAPYVQLLACRKD